MAAGDTGAAISAPDASGADRPARDGRWRSLGALVRSGNAAWRVVAEDATERSDRAPRASIADGVTATLAGRVPKVLQEPSKRGARV